MKSLLLLLLLTSLFSTACNSKNKKKNAQQTVDSTVIQQGLTETEKKIQELQDLAPLSTDQLKLLLPDTWMGVAKTNEEANHSMGAENVTAEYLLNDSSSIKLNIFDCSGPAGAGIYSLQFVSLLDYSADNESEYTKVVTLNGDKAIEHCIKSTVTCSLTYFSGGKFLVTLEGNNVNADLLKEAAKSLHIK